MQRLFTPTKLNVAALGNMVAQLHVHIIARFDNDVDPRCRIAFARTERDIFFDEGITRVDFFCIEKSGDLFVCIVDLAIRRLMHKAHRMT